ncbi:hypothetical protein Peur_020793 [Populus x canadensis]
MWKFTNKTACAYKYFHQLTARIIEKAAINLTYLYRICHFWWLFQCLNLYLFHHF